MYFARKYSAALLYNEVLPMTNDFLCPSNSKIDEEEPRYNESSFQRTNFAIPLALRYVEVPLYYNFN